MAFIQYSYNLSRHDTSFNHVCISLTVLLSGVSLAVKALLPAVEKGVNVPF